MNRAVLRRTWVGLALGLSMAAPALSQTRVDVALAFFRAGGAYCFRVTLEGVAISEERQWTVMVLTSASNRKNLFRIREVDPGNTGLDRPGLAAAGRAVTGVWRFDGERADFFERFAVAIRTGVLRARVVRISPDKIDRLTSDRERAEAYLKFSERGSRVDFGPVEDLDADEWAQYSTYFPD